MTDIPTIDDLPPAPQRGQDAAVFVQRADAFIDALADFVAQLNAFGTQLVLATQERVVNEAAASFDGAAAARDAAIAARDAAQAFADSIDPATFVKLTDNQAIAGTKNFTGILQLAGAAITAAATFPEATTTEMLANVQSRLVSVRSSWNALISVALADAATIAVDLNLGINFTVTIAGNRVLANPSNGKPGQTGSIFVTQDATGGRVLSFGANYVPDDLVTFPVLNPAVGAVTELRYKVAPDGKVRLYGGKPLSSKLVFNANMNGQGLGGHIAPRKAGTYAVTVFFDRLSGNATDPGWSYQVCDMSGNNPGSVLGGATGTTYMITLTADQMIRFRNNGSQNGQRYVMVAVEQ